MPSDNNSTGTFEVPTSPNVDPQFQLKLNERMRRIATAIQNGGTGGASGSSSSGSSSGSIGQLAFTVPGTLAIESTAAPLAALPVAKTFTGAVLLLEQVPSGGSVTVQIYVDGALWGSAMSTNQQKSTVSLAGTPAIAQDAVIRLAVTGVGTGLFAGAGLTVLLR